MSKVPLPVRWLGAIVIHAITLFALIKIGEMFIGELTVRQFSSNYDFGGTFSQWKDAFALATTNYFFIACGISVVLFIIWHILYAIPAININASRYVKGLLPMILILFLVAELVFMLIFVNQQNLPSSLISFFITAFIFVVPFIVSLLIASPYVIQSPSKWFRG
jgi:hypothetical protein